MARKRYKPEEIVRLLRQAERHRVRLISQGAPTMVRSQGHALTNRIVDHLSVDGRDAIFWDRDLPGFGVRV